MKRPLDILGNEITYVLRCGDYVKIGHSAVLEMRLRSFQPGNPYTITVLATFPLGELYERYLHRKFKNHWHRDEWYRIEGALADWMRRGFPHKKEIASLLKEHRFHRKSFAEWRSEVQRRKDQQSERMRRVKESEERAAAQVQHAEFWRTHDHTTGMKIPQVTT